MENIAQSSQFVEKFPSNDDVNQIRRHDEPMDVTEKSDSQNFASYLNLNYSKITEDDSKHIRSSLTVRKRLFCETSPNTSLEVQSNSRKIYKMECSEECSSHSCSSDDESSSNNSLLFNLQRSYKRKIDYLDSSSLLSSSSSDEDDFSTTIVPASKNIFNNTKISKNHLMDSDDGKCSVSSVDYSIKDDDYTIFREELSLKIAEESFAVSTENEFSENEESENNISIQTNNFTEEICENYITEFIEEIINDMIISIILGVEEPEHNLLNSVDRPLENDIVQESSEQIIEKIIEEVIDELIESIELNSLKNIVENSIEKIIEDILEDIIFSLPAYNISEETTSSDSVKRIIEEIFGENTYSSLQNIVYDIPQNSDFMEYSVAEGSDNEIVEEMSFSHNSARVTSFDTSLENVSFLSELNRDSEMLEPNPICDPDSSLIDVNDLVVHELNKDSDFEKKQMSVSNNSANLSRETSSATDSVVNDLNRDSDSEREMMELNSVADQDFSQNIESEKPLMEDQPDTNDSVVHEMNRDSDSESEHNSSCQSRDLFEANDSVVNEMNRDSYSENEMEGMEPNPTDEQDSSSIENQMEINDSVAHEINEMEAMEANPTAEQNQMEINDSVAHEMNRDSYSENSMEAMEPNRSSDQNASQNENETNQNEDVLNFMLRNFSEMKNSTIETREPEPQYQPVQEFKPILQESTKENIESRNNIAVASNLFPLLHKRETVDSLVTAFAPLVLQPRPNFDDLPIATSSFLSVRHKKGLRAIMSNAELSIETKNAQKNERKREMLIKSKKEMMEELNADGSSIALDYDSERKEFVTVHPEIAAKLKKHQVEGLKFMYDSCFVGVDTIETFPGSGCILAHCMGLGKTLQLIALIHTIGQYDKLRTKRILVLCPKTTVMNWVDEIVRWTGSVDSKIPLKSFVFPDDSNINHKITVMNNWHNSGSEGNNHVGVLLCGYEAFRGLVNRKYQGKGKAEKKNDYIKSVINKTLLKPGADLVVCDEGHIIKNDGAATSRAITQVQTKRRIILTGTPIQNNLTEYFCMVDFVKPSFLGSKREFNNIYANPIKKGEAKDSLPMDIRKMKEQSYILNRKMSPFVHRREQSVLQDFLPDKIEYVISVPITDIQIKLYKHYLGVAGSEIDIFGGKSLISDYSALRKVWTHPKIIEVAYNKALVTARLSEARRTKIFNEDHEEDVDRNDLNRFKDINSVTSTWWKPLIKRAELESFKSSNKMILLFEILKKCKAMGEKCLIFSAYVTVLNCVEHFMKLIQEKHENNSGDGFENFEGPWVYGTDFYRIDGQTSRTDRHKMITKFNNKENKRTVCFLISAKAGGQGINLTGASRAVILDTSWNPATDQQCIFRIYRLGQEKTCYIYRLLSMGTMEEKIYSRSVTKQALSGRVVDKRVIDGKFTNVELRELYTLTLTDYNSRPFPVMPKDRILLELLCEFPRIAFQYHEHDTLLEHNQNEALTDAEKREAWQSDLTKSRRGGLDDFPQTTPFPIDAMVASIMSDIYENNDRVEVLPNLIQNKENIQQFNLPETFTGENYENIIRTDSLQELPNHLTENCVNVPFHNSAMPTVNLLATASSIENDLADMMPIASELAQNLIASTSIIELPNHLTENCLNVPSHNSAVPTVNLQATDSSIETDLADMMPIASELAQNLIASTSIIDLTPDTQYDSDVSIVNSPIISKRPKPVVIDLTYSQPEFDMSSLMQQPVTTNNSPNCSSRLAKKRKQPSILQYVVKSPKLTTIIPIKKENKFNNKILNIPLKVDRCEDEMDDYFIEPETIRSMDAIDEEFNVCQSPVEEISTNNLIEYAPYSPLNSTDTEELSTSPMEEEESFTANGDEPYEKEEEVVSYSPINTILSSEDLGSNPMEEDESSTVSCDLTEDEENSDTVIEDGPISETIKEFRTAAMEEGEESTILFKTPYTGEDGYNPAVSGASISNIASINEEMENISKISFSESLDIDFDLFLNNWNTETLNTDFNSNEEVNSQDIIHSPAEADNLPVVEKSNEKTDNLL